MKAVTVRAFSENISDHHLETSESQILAKSEVKVAMKAASINYPDLLMMSGQYQSIPEFPFTPGMDGAGVIEEVAEDVLHLKVGDHVLINTEYGCYADQLITDVANCYIIPEVMSFTDAAALGLVYQTSYAALVYRAKLQPEETVLINGAGGGVGMAAIQIAKGLGAKAIAVVRNKRQAEIAEKSGADRIIFIDQEITKNCIRDQLKNIQVDVLIDPVGGDLFDESLRALSWSGRAVIVGFASGKIPTIKGNYLLLKNISVSGLQWTSYQHLKPELIQKAHKHLVELFLKGFIRPQITQIFKLSEFEKAVNLFKQSGKQGKILLSM